MVNTLVRIIIADDEVDITQRIASRITKETGFEVVGIAHNGFDAYELIERLNADVLLTDIHMPFIDGIELKQIETADVRKNFAYVSQDSVLFNGTLKENILYKCGWSPFEGYSFKSRVTHTFVNGKLVYANGKVKDEKAGQRLLFDREE